MKRKSLFLGGLLFLSCISGFLMSKASWVGRAGMTLVYREYLFLKTWWKGAAVVAVAWLLLFIIQGTITRNYDRKKYITVHVVCIVLALLGAFVTYQDFTKNLSHKLLGSAFHTGAYLFWAGWIAISIFYLVNPKNKPSFYKQEMTTNK